MSHIVLSDHYVMHCGSHAAHDSIIDSELTVNTFFSIILASFQLTIKCIMVRKK